jgi:hypothetical protein
MMDSPDKRFSQWGSGGRRPRGGRAKSHAELQRTSSIGYGHYRPSPPRGDGNIHFFGVEAARPATKRKRR